MKLSLLPSTVVLVALVASAVVPIAAQEVCHTTSMPPFRGLLTKISGDGGFVFDTNVGVQTVSPNELVIWGALTDTADGTQVVFADGSVIIASDVEIDGESLLIQANLFGQPQGIQIVGTSRVPLTAVRAILYRAPLQSDQRDALLKRIEQAQGNEDHIWLANGDTLRGTLTKLTPRSIEIKTSAGPLVIEPADKQQRLLHTVTALVFNPLLVRNVRRDEPHTLVGLSDGSRLFVQKFEPQENQIVYQLLCGATLKSHPDESVIELITSLQSLSPSVQYLSDLAPRKYLHTPLLARQWPLSLNENVTGGQLRSDGHLYVRGLGMHSRSRVLFLFDKPYRKLECEVALDQSAGEDGSVNFAVSPILNGKIQEPTTSPIVRGGDAPLHLSVDVQDASGVILFVTEADRGTALDRANWLNPRLIE